MVSRRNRQIWLSIACWSVVVVFAVVTAGRLHRPFGEDEPWVASVVKGGFYPAHGITTPPILFFPAVLTSRTVSGTELPMRLPAYVFGLLLVASPILYRPLTSGWLSAGATFAWVALLSASSPIVFYTARVKQYTGEAFVAVTLLSLGLWLAGDPDSQRRLRIFALVAALAVLATDTAAFVIAGIGLTLLFWSRSLPKESRFRVRFVKACSVVATAFVMAYFGYLKPRSRMLVETDVTEYFRTQSAREYFDGTPSFVISRTTHWLGHYLSLTRFMLATTVLVIGVWAVRSVPSKPGRARFWVLGGFAVTPGILALFASGLSLYPYGEVRLMAFLFPGFAMLVSEAWVSLLGLRRSRLWAAAVILIGLGFLALDLRNGLLRESYARTYMGEVK